MSGDQDATKRAILERLLDQGMVLVTVDARVEGVQVPPDLFEDSQLRLNLSLRFGRPMECTDEGVAATLTFGGAPFDCFLPWDAIYMLISHSTGQPFLFPADVPDDAEAGRPSGIPEDADTPRLTLVSADGEEETAAADTEAADSTNPPPDKSNGRSHLRVVK